MAIITEDELQLRLGHTNNAAKGRTNGAGNIPDKLREIIGFQAHFETASDVAKAFQVSPISAHLAKESRGNEDVKNKIDERLGIVRDSALEKMLTAMGVISDEKIKKLKVNGALRVVESMAKVLERTDKKDVSNNAQILIYAPQVRSESDYGQVIEVEKLG